jgi:hypothetical protein
MTREVIKVKIGLFRKGFIIIIAVFFINIVVFSFVEPIDATSVDDLQIVGVTDITCTSATVNIKDTGSLPLSVEIYYWETDNEDEYGEIQVPQLVNPGETYGQVITEH